MLSRTTIEITDEQRMFLDRLPHGSIKVLMSALLDCAIELSDRYGERKAAAFIQGGLMRFTDRPKEGD